MKYVFALLFLGGCASGQLNWKPDPTKNKPKDQAECQATAGQATPEGAKQLKMFSSRTDRQDIYEDCMKGKGWILLDD